MQQNLIRLSNRGVDAITEYIRAVDDPLWEIHLSDNDIDSFEPIAKLFHSIYYHKNYPRKDALCLP